MAETVYLETTIPSYLAGRPNRDLVIAAHQQLTHDWWSRAKERFDLYVSEAVLEEIRAGDPAVAAKRLEVVVRDEGDGFGPGPSEGLGAGLMLIGECADTLKVDQSSAGVTVEMVFQLR